MWRSRLWTKGSWMRKQGVCWIRRLPQWRGYTIRTLLGSTRCWKPTARYLPTLLLFYASNTYMWTCRTCYKTRKTKLFRNLDCYISEAISMTPIAPSSLARADNSEVETMKLGGFFLELFYLDLWHCSPQVAVFLSNWNAGSESKLPSDWQGWESPLPLLIWVSDFRCTWQWNMLAVENCSIK